jgi:hypothetical protein
MEGVCKRSCFYFNPFLVCWVFVHVEDLGVVDRRNRGWSGEEGRGTGRGCVREG